VSKYSRIKATKIKKDSFVGPTSKLGRVPIHNKPGPGAYNTAIIDLYDSIVTNNKRLGDVAT